MKTTEFAIIGLGGVGGYFGFKLARKYAADSAINVTFIAREKTYDIVKENGLTLLSAENEDAIARPHQILKEVAELGHTDVFVICVKEYDLENICNQLKDKIKNDTVILPLMNGVDIYERIRKIISSGIVLPSCVYVASHIKEKGVVEHKGNPGKIIVGKDPAHQEFDPQGIVDLFKDASVDIDYKEDSFPAIWSKYFFIASFGLVSARYNKSIGQVNEEEELHQRALKVMQEIQAIAIRKEINLPENIIAQTFQKAASFPFQTPTSLQLDVQSGKENTELELFAGAIIAYGKALGIPVPETTEIYHEIKNGMLV
ncbi:ketopantoate reductase family protein [Pedobacter cryoconitis]|uniref:2-dehydropantoate 2-reductase n=1 Tax=Pedobacter cryoconitis TaxID=188932 RepID=A0A327SGQ7_9SPHI|nr:2-dehydropantoate 2-reductase [Pedobacter cryoconitis]RAJ24927.1 2-dehydropantoate 2-reductase [Pedobacter cryoconitis]